MFKNIREYENLHISLWLLKDLCWVTGEALPFMRYPGMFMIIPTFLVAVHITYRSRKIISDLFHNVAVCLWICANGTWMIGEFFFHDSLRNYAMVFFIIGIFVVGVYYIFHFPNRKLEPENVEE